MQVADPGFWRAGAISIIVVMTVVLAMLTVDSLAAIDARGSHVPHYTVINRQIGYKFGNMRGIDTPAIGGTSLLFGHEYTEQQAALLIRKSKLVIQSRACMDCHTFFGNGAYYAPDLTKAWLDPAWEAWKAITSADTQEDAMVRFLMDPVQYRTWTRTMPDLHLSKEEAPRAIAQSEYFRGIGTFSHVAT